MSETAKDLLTEARACLASREASSSSSRGFFSLMNSLFIFFSLIKCLYLFFIHLIIVTLYLQQEEGVFKNNGKRGIGSDKEPITKQTKQRSSKSKDSTRRATANKFVRVDDSIAKPTANKFVNATDDITIHVGDACWVHVCSRLGDQCPFVACH